MAHNFSFKLANDLTDHDLDLIRVGAGTRRKVLGQLKRLEFDLIGAIADFDPTSSPSAQARLDKMNRLLEQTTVTIRNAYRATRGILDKDLIDLSELETKFALKSINDILQVEIMTTALPLSTLKRLSKKTLIQGAQSSEWWSRQAGNLRRSFSDEMAQGILRGESVGDLIKRVRGTATGKRNKFEINGKTRTFVEFEGGLMDTGTRQAEALVRTSVQQVSNAVRIETLEANSDVVGGIQFLATLDNRTTDICQAHSNLTWDLITKEPIGHSTPFPGAPPLHWNCVFGTTSIYTATGWILIKEIKVGDWVMTHAGRFQKVTELHKNKKYGTKIITLHNKNRRTLKLTENHPVLINGKWVVAKDVKVGDLVSYLASRCQHCDKLVPFNVKYCSQSCCSLEGYADGTLDRNTIALAAQKKMRKLCDKGKHPKQINSEAYNNNTKALKARWNDDEFRNKMVKRMKENNPMLDLNARKRATATRKQTLIDRPEILEKGTEKMKQFFIDHPEKHPNRIMAQKGHITSLEKIMFKILENLGIDFEREFPILQYFADFALPTYKVVIECDGEHWHKNKEKDKIRQDKIEAEGWSVLRFTGKWLRADPAGIEKMLQRLFLNHGSQYEFLDLEVISKEIEVPTKKVTLYNLSVENDESYIANGFVVHNCRSTLVPVTKSFEEMSKNSKLSKKLQDVPSSTQASMDGQVSDTLNYQDWLKAKSKKVQREILGKGKFDLFNDGKLKLTDLIDSQTSKPLTVKALKKKLG